MTNANGAASAAPLAVSENTSVAERDHLELVAAKAIEEVNDPEEALELLGKVKTAAEAVRHAKWGRERTRRWQGFVILAERRYGELLPPKQKPGPRSLEKRAVSNSVLPTPPVSNSVLPTPPVSNSVLPTPGEKADAMVQARARQVAAVPKDTVQEYVETDPRPTRAGLLRSVDGSKSPPQRPDANWNGKTVAGRSREIREQRRALSDQQKHDYGDLLELQQGIDKAVVLLQSLERLRAKDFEMDEAEVALVNSIHDDLITLGEAHDRLFSKVQSWLGDARVLAKIRGLLAKAKSTQAEFPEEAKNLRAGARRMQRKLNSRLGRGRSGNA